MEHLLERRDLRALVENPMIDLPRFRRVSDP